MSPPSLSRFHLSMVVFAVAATAFAAGHLKIEGIAGSSTRPGREKWVDILSFHWGVTPAGNPGPESKMLNFTIAAGTPESEKLVNAARAGTRFRAVTFDSGEKVYRMRDVGVRWIGRGGTKQKPTESLYINPKSYQIISAGK